MSETSKIIENLLESEQLFEMANLRKSRTNLPVNILLDEVGDNRNNKHYLPRIKIQNDYADRANGNTISISIDKENPVVLVGKAEIDSKDLSIIIEWIKENYEVLMKHWKGEIDTDDLKEDLRKRGEYK